MGYSGSRSRNTENPATQNPTYQNVQDYAESIRVTFDRSKWTYEQMIDNLFKIHTPRHASMQYRSAIFVHTERQRALAKEACKKRGYSGKLVSVELASDFYRAEEYHQKYIERQQSHRRL